MNYYLNSKNVKKGDVYISLNGRVNGDKYIKDALKNGASFIMSENKGEYYRENLKKNLNKILLEKYDIKYYPKLIGITGTDSKTTLAINLNRKMNEIKIKSFVITTIKGIENSYYSELTTPRNDDLIRIIKDASEKGIEYLIMEVSSIGYKEGRVNDLDFELGIITNLTKDHLDYHHSIYNYHKAKIDFLLSCNKLIYKNQNVYKQIEESLHIRFKDYVEINPPGREEVVKLNPFVIVDYAHTVSSYEYILKKYSKLKKNKLIIVFGFGGNRDKTKRKEIIELVNKYSDYAIITNDNPRFEKETKIIKDALNVTNIKIILNRKNAIYYALDIQENDDILLIIGKGHEDYQIIKNKRIHFNDKEIVNEYFVI